MSFKRWEVVAGKHPSLGSICEVFYSSADRFKIPRVMCKNPDNFLVWADNQNFSEENRTRLLLRVSYILAWE